LMSVRTCRVRSTNAQLASTQASMRSAAGRLSGVLLSISAVSSACWS
jgi:hypothetical protein